MHMQQLDPHHMRKMARTVRKLRELDLNNNNNPINNNNLNNNNNNNNSNNGMTSVPRLRRTMCKSYDPQALNRQLNGGQSSRMSGHGDQQQQQRRPTAEGSGSSRRHSLTNRLPSIGAYGTDFAHCVRHAHVPMPPQLFRSVQQQSASQPRTTAGRDQSKKLTVTGCVCRSSSSSSSSGGQVCRLEPQLRQICLSEPSTSKQTPKAFIFDAVHQVGASTSDELNSSVLGECLQSVLSGQDAALLCLGYPSHGKQSSIYGGDQGAAQLGLFPTAVCWLYKLVADLKRARPDTRWSIRVSAVEVHAQNETLADLLIGLTNGANDREEPSICIEDDPIFGPQLQHVSELRAPSADKAALYLDAALHHRHNKSADEARNSHLFYTLHIYQYQVDQTNTKVAGGRCRLHLIELGQGEKSSRAGRNSLTFPAIGNVLHTIVQGQKYMPFRDSKLTSLLRDALSHSHISLLAYGCDDVAKHQETLNTFNVAQRLCRVKKKTYSKKGSDTSSGLGRSASDPEYTSSSEQSAAETVIFLGNAKDQADGGSSCCSVKPSQPRMGAKVGLQQPGKQETWIDGPKASSRSNPSSARSTPKHKIRGEAVLTSEPLWVDGPKASPIHRAANPAAKSNKSSTSSDDKSTSDLDPLKRAMIQAWVTEVSTSPAKHILSSPTEIPDGAEALDNKFAEQPSAAADKGAGRNGNGSVKSPESGDSSVCSPPALPAPSHDGSMCTSSDDSKEPCVAEHRSFGCQADDADIDSQTRQSQLSRAFCAYRQNYLDQLVNEADVHILEDISECDEDNLSSMGNSAHRRQLQQERRDGPMIRNEALAAPPIHLDLGSLADLDGGTQTQQESGDSSHRLCALSSQFRSDTFSIASDLLDRLSVCADDDDDADDDCVMDEDDLERAMADSVASSVKSHDIVMILKDEMDKQAAREAAYRAEEKRLLSCNWHAANQRMTNRWEAREPTLPPSPTRPPPAVTSSLPTSPANGPGPKLSLLKYDTDKQNKQSALPKRLPGGLRGLCCTNNNNNQSALSSSGSSSQQSSSYKPDLLQQQPSQLQPVDEQQQSAAAMPESARSEKLIRPSIPPVSPAIRSEITSKLISFTSRNPRPQPQVATTEQQQSNTLPHPPKVTQKRAGITHFCLNDQTDTLVGDCCCPVTQVVKQSHSQLQDTSTYAHASGSLPRQGWRRRGSTDSQQQQQPAEQQSAGRTAIRVQTRKQSVGTSPRHTGTDSAVANAASSSSSKPYSFMSSFLKPAKPTDTQTETMSKRASSGYESGHETGSGGGGGGTGSKLTVMSPYAKLTKPRHKNTAGSSGHGSDSGNSDPSQPLAVVAGRSRFGSILGSRTKLTSASASAARNRESFSASSGYESAGYPDYACVPAVLTRHNPLRHTMPVSKSEPQTPCVTVAAGYSEVQLPGTPIKQSALVSEQQERVLGIKRRQRQLKKELIEAKQRINVPDDNVSFELHVEKCMELGEPGLPEALEAETRILAKRVTACQNHVMVVTSFL